MIQKVLFFLAIIVFISLLVVYQYFNRPAKPMAQGIKYKVIIPSGASCKEIASLLAQKGLIRSKWIFFLKAWQKGITKDIKAGEYLLSPSQTPKEILEILHEGKILLHKITIPEGANLWDIAELFAKEGITSQKEFLRLASDPCFIKSLGLKEKTLEGYLFPETYLFSKPIKPQKMISIMVEQFWKVWKEFAPRAHKLGLDVHQVITLASIVEKEAHFPQERPIIASVFWNRLKRHMPLQADPTIRYALRKFKGPLTYKDLQVDNPYNTYKHPGLPPGPICNPSKDSIQAVLYPAHTNYLYFVAKGDGSHYFSRTLQEHLKAIKKFRPR